MSWVVDMFKVRARKHIAVRVGGDADVRGDGWEVLNCVELCMICRMRITSVRDCVGCCMMMSLTVDCWTCCVLERG